MEETNPMGLQNGGELGRMELPSRLRITLEIVSGPQKGQILEITKSCMTLGRCFRGVDLVDTSISRRHAVIEIYGDRGILLRDLASINGTHVNEHLIAQARLNDGDVVRMGMTEFRLQVQPRSS
jgi:predicted component of type VI protein secretion system